MVIGIVAAVAAAAFLLHVAGVGSTLRTQPVGRTQLSPLDEAERILASRYAHGEISSEEYDRAKAVLRR